MGIGSSKEGNTNMLAFPVRSFNAFAHSIYLLLEMIQNNRSWLILFLLCFPRINHQPVGRAIDGQLAHCNANE